MIGKRGATALGFVLLLKHYSRHGRFPRGCSDLHDGVIDFVARQVGVDGSEVGSYEWSGSTIEYHRAQIRAHLGFRVAIVADQEKMTAWLAVNVAHAERRPERQGGTPGPLQGATDRASHSRSTAAHRAFSFARG